MIYIVGILILYVFAEVVLNIFWIGLTFSVGKWVFRLLGVELPIHAADVNLAGAFVLFPLLLVGCGLLAYML